MGNDQTGNANKPLLSNASYGVLDNFVLISYFENTRCIWKFMI